MKTFLINFLKWFLIINSGILLIVGLNIFRYESISTLIIPQIFAASFLTSLVTTALFSYNPRNPIKKGVALLLYFGHYLVLCAIIMTLGTLFEWFEFSPKGALTVALSVAGVYFVSFIISYILSKGEADEMTKALNNLKDE
ncbi:MAG: DUF3021 family protein [Lachnospiraceae bacterium]|nr:DUF3021 family protein [Lachnospiraceae bacterium]